MSRTVTQLAGEGDAPQITVVEICRWTPRKLDVMCFAQTSPCFHDAQEDKMGRARRGEINQSASSTLSESWIFPSFKQIEATTPSPF